MEKLKTIRELTQDSTENCKVYELSNGQHRAVYTLESGASARSAQATGNAPIACYSYNAQSNTSTTPQVVSVSYSSKTHLVFALSLSGYGTGHKTITKAVIRFRESSGSSSNNIRLFKTQEGLSDGAFIIESSESTCLDFYQRFTENGISYREVNVASAIADDPDATHYFSATSMDSASTTSLYTEQSSYKPQLIVDYIPRNDYAKNQKVITGDADNAGDYEVNIRTGRLTFAKPLIALGGNLMPLTASLCFDEAYITTQNVGKNTYFPKGWKLNYQQYCYLSGGKYYYIDGAFKQHVFESTGVSNQYYDTSGTKMLLTVSGSTITIQDGIGTAFVFTDGYLTKIEDSSSTTHKTTIMSYTSGKLMSVTDGMERTMSITYGTSSITLARPDGKTVVLSYNSDLMLTGVTEADGKTVTYGYLTESASPFALTPGLTVTKYKLQTATGSTGKKVKFTFNSAYSVNKIEESVGSNATKTYTLDYGCKRTVVGVGKNGATNTLYTVYDYDENGNFFAEYERTAANAVMGGIYRSVNGFSKQKANLGVKSYAKMSYSGGTYALSSAAQKIASLSLTGATEERTFVFSAKATMQAVSNLKLGVENKVELVLTYCDCSQICTNHVLTTVAFNPNESGQQKAFGLFKIYNESNPVVNVKINLSGEGSVTFNDFEIFEVADQINGDYVNVNTGESTVSESGTNWYALRPCDVKYGSTVVTNVKMTAADILATQESKQKGQNGLWYNDGQKYVGNVTDAKLVCGTQEYSVYSTKVASIKKTSLVTIFRKTSVTASGFTTTIHTVGLDEDRICTVQHNANHRLTSQTDANGATTNYTYDNWGNLTSVRKALSGASGILYTQSHGTNGKFPVSDSEYFQDTTKTKSYSYTESTGNVITKTYPSQQVENYEYMANAEDISNIWATVSSVQNKNTFGYTSGGLVSSVSHNGVSHEFAYDGRNNLATFKTAGSTVLSVSRDYATLEEAQTLTYANGATKYQKFDKYGKLIKEGASSSSIDWTYIYCEEDASTLTSATDSTGLTVTATSPLKKRYSSSGSEYYTYDGFGRIVKEQLVGKTVDYEYTGELLTGKAVTIGSDTWTEDYEYELQDELNGSFSLRRAIVNCGGKQYEVISDKDSYGRISSASHQVLSTLLSTDYTYASRSKPSGESGTTERISVADVKLNNVSAYSEEITYDTSGNIAGLKQLKNGQTVGTVRYTYDGLNRLIREDNPQLSQTYVYAYNAGGNITSKKTYAYTTGSLTNASYSTKSYSYDSSKKDRLVSWNGKSFAYDAYGNPTTYKSKACTWTKGTLLSSFGDVTMTYGKDGERTGKSVTRAKEGTFPVQMETTTTSYTWVGDKLYKETSYKGFDETTLKYVYAGEELVGFFLNGTAYLYRKNVQGDIVGIYNTSGVEVGKYTYDAWGHCSILLDSSGIATANPFRYRGYYYDADLGLYYLKTRYYDPETGRFISPDSPKYIAPEILNGLNLYAYCNNNPVMNIDPNGNAWWEWVLGALAVVGITAAVATGAAFVAGAVAGTATASAVATGATIGGLVLGGAELVSQGASSDWGDLDWGGLAIETVSGSLYGAMTGLLYSTGNLALQRSMKVGLVGLAGATEGIKSVRSGDSFWEMALNMTEAMGTAWLFQNIRFLKKEESRVLQQFFIKWNKIFYKSILKVITKVLTE